MIKFKILLLNEEGMDRQRDGLDHDEDKYYDIKPCLINPQSISIIYPMPNKVLNKDCTFMETVSGNYKIMQSFEEVEQIMAVAKVIILQ